ncbi:peptidoglycan D,D-transpeptidase FtsI family protein [Alienimonas californiensis]|uniref:Peptidoglycan D,D-transpeptidase FtsI n=1 Tax=Alienimonas californiensis TaxID=2527989 RepID=A0A517PCQ2_9PLAN|nr:penicillin-binding protein 2 [Alienimonas californiensis]QDT17152.1 Peptidoglycan D,D-transpeptidase FtsI [Alienimonas californiensis]
MPAPPRLRETAAFLGLAAFAAAIAVRLAVLAIGGGESLAATAVRQRQVETTLPARPGDLLDRHGRLLATTVTADSLYLVPRAIPAEEIAACCATLAEAIDADAADLEQKIRERPDGWFLWVRRRLDEDTAGRVRDLALPDEWWGFRAEYRRRTPLGRVGGSVVGLRNLDGRGVNGMERVLDARLRGVPGVRTSVRDARGASRAVLENRSRPPVPGEDVALTIDAAIQRFAEAELDHVQAEFAPVWSCLLITDPHTGETLAAASRPAFDPENLAGLPPAAWTHHAFGTPFEPGSTVKPLFVGAALAEGFATVDETIDCENGRWQVPGTGRLLRDVARRGALTPGEILIHSSNIGVAKLAGRMGNATLHRIAATYGFGRPVGANLPGPAAGSLRPLEGWDDYSTQSVPIGHELTVTAAHLAAAHGALANGGTLLPLTLVRGGRPPVASRVLPREWADWLVAGPLAAVVEEGTARRTRGDDYRLFGKTGTAQLWDAEAGRYAEDRTTASAVIGGPVRAPRLLAVCVVHDPQGETRGGGSVAAPAAANVLRFGLRRLRVAGDAAPLPSPVTARDADRRPVR